MPDYNAEHLREAAARSDENNRLVQGRKSPTRPKVAHLSHRIRQLAHSKRRAIELDTESAYNAETLYGIHEAGNRARVLSPEKKSKVVEPNIAPNTVRLMKQDWSGRCKVQYYTQTPSSGAPDQQQGDRYTEKLTKRAVSKIFESAAYIATCHGGFTTFFTPTFSKEQRNRIFGGMVEGDGTEYCTLPKPPLPASKTRGPRSLLSGRPQVESNDATHTPIHIRRNMAKPVTHIAGPYCYIDTEADDPAATVDILDDGTVKVMNENGDIAGPYCPIFAKPEKPFTLTKTAESTIGKEISRFLDGVKKMFKRGWQGIDKNGEPFQIPEREDDFHYIWVAECPANKDGEPNPHVHILLNWTVEPEQFNAWTQRIEGIWGNGTVHVERIKHPKAAGTYIIKAVGYAAKGDNADQGLIRGNRYNIAQCSRAPDWTCLASFEADNMAAIIKECGYILEQWRKPLNRSLRRTQKQLDQTIKAKAIAKQAKKPEQEINKLTARIIRLEHQARAGRDQLRSREVFATTKNIFCFSIDGENAEEKAYDFLLWAAGARGWSMTPVSDEPEQKKVYQEIRAAARHEYAPHYEHFQQKRAYWRCVLNDPLTPNRAEPTELERSAYMADLEHYMTQPFAA
ncbi:rolling circle replication-associated protein [Photobacterium nomapromontoriensis]|uniref:rolling circle replication-associated protein n=1 Tax=Photobacterium nomapromontoriensis TaxID=2910237 RepID=UPI003D130D2F